MAFTVTGWVPAGQTKGLVGDTVWSQIARWNATGHAGQVVTGGFGATPGTGRQLLIGAGTLFMPGLRVVSDAEVAVALGTATEQITVLEANWSTKSVVLRQVTPATLVQSAGSVWQVPLWQTLIGSGVAQVTTAHLNDCRPERVGIRTYYGSAVPEASMGPSHDGVAASVLRVPSPGYPFQVEVTADLYVAGDSGYAQAWVTVDGQTLPESTVYSGGLTTSNGVQPVRVSAVSTGHHHDAPTVQVRVRPAGVQTGDTLDLARVAASRMRIRTALSG